MRCDCSLDAALGIFICCVLSYADFGKFCLKRWLQPWCLVPGLPYWIVYLHVHLVHYHQCLPADCVSPHGSNLSTLKVCASKLKSLGLSGAFRNWLNAFSYAALILRTTCFMTGAAWLCWRIAFIDLWSYERTVVGLWRGFSTQIHRIVCCFIEQIVEFVRRPILPHYTK